MKRHGPLMLAALACGLSVAAVRSAEDEDRRNEDRDFERLNRRINDLPEPAKVHKHSREIARRLRQKAAREAKRGEQ